VTERVVLASKGRFGGGQEVNAAGLSRASDMHTPVEETLSFLDGAVKAGKIHYIGLSNFTGWQLQLILHGEGNGRAGSCDASAAIQPAIPARLNGEIVPAALHNGISLPPCSLFAGGSLTGEKPPRWDRICPQPRSLNVSGG
jgi:aryl-alcohol dehydrogenase-like predicted oxidoreductase